jgi:hypothetical protein
LLGIVAGAWALIAAAPADTAVQPEQVRAVVDTIARQLRETYPLPDISEAWAKEIHARAKAGTYAGLDAQALARAIQRDLQASHRDLHLAVRYDPALFAKLTHQVPPAPTPPEPPAIVHAIAEATLDSTSATLYLRNKGGWKTDDETFAAISGAMMLGQSARNVVIDLRDCPGGNGAIGRYLAAYFFAAGRSQFYLDGFFRDGHRMQEWTADKVPGPTLPDAKLYVLIGKHTASACEGFAYAMQQMKRATLVGDTSAGAGIAVRTQPVLDGIVLYLPFKMIVGPHSDKGWEGVGVVPDVPANGVDAAEVAFRLIRSEPVQGTPAKVGS